MPRVKLATYNVANLFATISQVPQEGAKEVRQIAALGRVLNKMRADVVVIQEVENDRALGAVNARLAKPYEHFEVVESNYHRGLHLGAMSRFGFRSRSHRDRVLSDVLGQPMVEFASPKATEKSALLIQRDLLLHEFDIPGFGVLAVFGVHLKSQGMNDWRTLSNAEIAAAEAREVAVIVKEYCAENPEVPVVLLGDFNREVDDEAIEPLIDGLGFVDVVGRDWLPENQPAYSYHLAPFRNRIDFVLLSARAMDFYVAGSACIYSSADAKRASDHFPVTVELDLSLSLDSRQNRSQI